MDDEQLREVLSGLLEKVAGDLWEQAQDTARLATIGEMVNRSAEGSEAYGRIGRRAFYGWEQARQGLALVAWPARMIPNAKVLRYFLEARQAFWDSVQDWEESGLNEERQRALLAGDKSIRSGSKGGRTSKRPEGVLIGIKQVLRRRPAAMAREVFETFPEESDFDTRDEDGRSYFVRRDVDFDGLHQTRCKKGRFPEDCDRPCDATCRARTVKFTPFTTFENWVTRMRLEIRQSQ